MDICRTVTDETLREAVSHGKNDYPFAYYPEDIWRFDFHRIGWHWHNELEFLVAASGNAVCCVGEDKINLPQGCGVFINSGILHRFEAYQSVYAPNIVFAPSLLAPEESLIYQKYVRPVIVLSAPYQILEPHIVWQRQILQILGQIFALQEEGGRNELSTVRMLLEIWGLLEKNMEQASGLPKLRRLNHKQAQLQTMIQFIHDHYMEEITLEEIAGAASLSKSGALHIFQSGIHTSPVAYLIGYRLSRAAAELLTTQKPVSVIASDTGFASAGYFCRKFRQHYHMSAGEYRKGKQGKNMAERMYQIKQ